MKNRVGLHDQLMSLGNNKMLTQNQLGFAEETGVLQSLQDSFIVVLWHRVYGMCYWEGGCTDRNRKRSN